MTGARLPENLTAWLKTASASDVVCVLDSVAAELYERRWPPAGACFLAAAELHRFVALHGRAPQRGGE